MLLKLPIITVNEVLRMGGGNMSSIWTASRFLGTGLTRSATGRVLRKVAGWTHFDLRRQHFSDTKLSEIWYLLVSLCLQLSAKILLGGGSLKCLCLYRSFSVKVLVGSWIRYEYSSSNQLFWILYLYHEISLTPLDTFDSEWFKHTLGSKLNTQINVNVRVEEDKLFMY